MSQKASENTLQQIAQWREKLQASSLPVFSQTVRDVGQVSQSPASSAQDLSDAISNDASMSARVIQIANSPMFNPHNRPVDTISGAVVLVGFDAVRDLAISVSVIEEVLKGNAHSQVGLHMSRAFHAATHARSFAHHERSEHAEEVFVAALLKSVGPMAFWSRAGEEGAALEVALAEAKDGATAELAVLGFELCTLSQVLAADWNLGDLVTRVLDGRHTDDPLVAHVDLGHALAEVLETEDLESEAGQVMIARLSQHLGLGAEDIQSLVAANQEATTQIAERFGIDEKMLAAARSLTPHPMAERASDPTAGLGEPVDPARELLSVLDNIACELERGAGRAELMQMLLAGFASSLSLEFGYFALMNKDRTVLQVKYASAAAEALLSSKLSVSEQPEMNEILDNQGVWQTSESSGHPWLPCEQAAALVVRMGGKPVGVVYAGTEVEETGVTLQSDQEQRVFRQLALQTSHILSQAR